MIGLDLLKAILAALSKGECWNNSDRPEYQSQHLEVVYNYQYSHALCFIQMRLRSNHRRDLSAALRHHII